VSEECEHDGSCLYRRVGTFPTPTDGEASNEGIQAPLV
jgi:hypothetical protein